MSIHKVFLEHMPRLRCAIVHISHSPQTPPSSLGIREHHIELHPHTIHLPGTLQLDPSTVTGLIRQPDRIAFRVCTVPVTSQPNGNTFDEELLSPQRPVGDRVAPAARLPKLLPIIAQGQRVRLQCASCSHWLTQLGHFERVLELPSENIDAGEWFCHHHQSPGNASADDADDADDQSAGHSHSHDKDGDDNNDPQSNWSRIVGRPHDLLYGQYCFVLPHDRLSGARLADDDDQVRCGNCQHVLGVSVARQPMAKLWNESVLFVSTTETVKELMNQPTTGTRLFAGQSAQHFTRIVRKFIEDFDYLMSMVALPQTVRCLFEAAQPNGARQFLLVTVMNPSLDCWLSDAQPSTVNDVRLLAHTIMKVMFLAISVPNRDIPAPPLVASWEADSTVNCMQLSCEMLVAAANKLGHNSQLLSNEHRQAGGCFQISYLFDE